MLFEEILDILFFQLHFEGNTTKCTQNIRLVSSSTQPRFWLWQRHQLTEFQTPCLVPRQDQHHGVQVEPCSKKRPCTHLHFHFLFFPLFFSAFHHSFLKYQSYKVEINHKSPKLLIKIGFLSSI